MHAYICTCSISESLKVCMSYGAESVHSIFIQKMCEHYRLFPRLHFYFCQSEGSLEMRLYEHNRPSISQVLLRLVVAVIVLCSGKIKAVICKCNKSLQSLQQLEPTNCTFPRLSKNKTACTVHIVATCSQ